MEEVSEILVLYEMLESVELYPEYSLLFTFFLACEERFLLDPLLLIALPGESDLCRYKLKALFFCVKDDLQLLFLAEQLVNIRQKFDNKPFPTRMVRIVSVEPFLEVIEFLLEGPLRERLFSEADLDLSFLADFLVVIETTLEFFRNFERNSRLDLLNFSISSIAFSNSFFLRLCKRW